VALVARLTLNRSGAQESTSEDATQCRLSSSVSSSEDEGLPKTMPTSDVLLADLDGGFLAEYVFVT